MKNGAEPGSCELVEASVVLQSGSAAVRARLAAPRQRHRGPVVNGLHGWNRVALEGSLCSSSPCIARVCGVSGSDNDFFWVRPSCGLNSVAISGLHCIRDRSHSDQWFCSGRCSCASNHEVFEHVLRELPL